MKYIVLLIAAASLLVGCATMEEAYYTDREFGAATTDAFDRQVIHKDYAHAGKAVEGLPALHAEPVMEKYHSTFSQGFTRESIDISDVGSESSN